MTATVTSSIHSDSPFESLDIATFEAGDVSAETFTHEAHIFIGWSYLQKTDLHDGIQRYATALRLRWPVSNSCYPTVCNQLTVLQ